MQIINPNHRRFQIGRTGSLAVLVLAGISIFGLPGCGDRNQYQAAAGEGFPLTALGEIDPIAGRDADLGGKTLLINFWATWCAPCRNEMPDLQRLSDSLDRDRFAVIGISIDEDSNLVREFLLEYGIRFANYQDREQRLATGLLGIQALPATFIVAADGAILSRVTGERAWDKAIFEALLNGRQADEIARTGKRLDG